MNSFIPTSLYIKQHNQTGLKYFGKTQLDPLTYNGSGKYWKRHLKKYGYDVSTPWHQLFTDEKTLTEYALTFSKENDIVNSKEWANLIIENGLDGAPVGNILTEEAKSNMRKSWTDARRLAQAERTRLRNLGNKALTCPHCSFIGSAPGNMKRYHFDNCLLVKDRVYKSRVDCKSRATGWVLLSPTGQEFTVTNMREFCRNNELNNGTMSDVALGNRKQHKGWTVISTLRDDGTSL